MYIIVNEYCRLYQKVGLGLPNYLMLLYHVRLNVPA